MRGFLLAHRHGIGGILRYKHPTPQRESAQGCHRIALCLCFAAKPRPLVLEDTSHRPAVAIGLPTLVYLHLLTRRGTGQFHLPGGGHLKHGVTLPGESIDYENMTVLIEVRRVGRWQAGASDLPSWRQRAAGGRKRQVAPWQLCCVLGLALSEPPVAHGCLC